VLQLLAAKPAIVPRSRLGKHYFTISYVVAASAIAGKIIEPFEYLKKPDEELVGV